MITQPKYVQIDRYLNFQNFTWPLQHVAILRMTANSTMRVAYDLNLLRSPDITVIGHVIPPPVRFSVGSAL